MANQILFTEKQKFRQWWLWLLLIVINGPFLFGVFKQVYGGQSFGNNPMSNTALLVSSGLMILITILFLSLQLETRITKDGIHVRFFPFHLKFRYYAWENLKRCFVRQYSPITEYGGWGLRLGLFGKGTAFNVSGDMGLQLEFTNKKRLLIGTKKPVELTETLKEIDQLKQ